MDTAKNETQRLSLVGSSSQILRRFAQDYFICFAFIGLVAVFTVIQPLFLSGGNILNLLRQGSIIAIVSAGMFFVIVTGNIDISVGSTVALAGIVYSMLVRDLGFPLLLAALLAMVSGAAVGLINGVLIAYCHIPAFITTLGTMSVVRGLVYFVTNCYPITGLPANYKEMGRGTFWQVPIPVWLMFMAFILIAVLFEKTKFGRNLYAIGGNQEAAYLSGIHVKIYLSCAYIICSLLAAFAGLILSSRLDAGQATAGNQFEFEAITAVVIGGVSMNGGKGKVTGVFFGAIFIAALTNGMTLINVNSYLQQIIKGVVLVFAVGLDVLRNQKQ